MLILLLSKNSYSVHFVPLNNSELIDRQESGGGGVFDR